LPLGAALFRRHRDSAREIEEARCAREHGTSALDSEDDLITFVKLERVTDGLRHRQLTLRGKLRRDIHFGLLTHRLK
jgi:hypothetical protein